MLGWSTEKFEAYKIEKGDLSKATVSLAKDIVAGTSDIDAKKSENFKVVCNGRTLAKEDYSVTWSADPLNKVGEEVEATITAENTTNYDVSKTAKFKFTVSAKAMENLVEICKSFSACCTEVIN